jgi:hypothetical protein
MADKLRRNMTEEEFENGYWYAEELKAFAKAIGIPHSGVLRKDELERSIKRFFKTGKASALATRNLTKGAAKDVLKGLALDLPVVNYTNDPETKDFIVREARKKDPDFRERSGARYRLNRWREDQLGKGKRIVYGDLVDQFVNLNRKGKEYERIPSARYLNFLSDYLRENPGSTLPEAIAAWNELKTKKVPKTFSGWKRIRR